MGTITELRAPVVRRATSKFRGRGYTVALLPGDVLELRSLFSRQTYRAALGAIFECLVGLRERAIEEEEGAAGPSDDQRIAQWVDELCTASGQVVVRGVLTVGTTSHRSGTVYALAPAVPEGEASAVSATTPWFPDLAGLLQHALDRLPQGERE